MGSTLTLGVIGGSGLYAMPGLEDLQTKQVETTFGSPSDAIVCGKFGKTRLLFLPRHGVGHRIPPHKINYRANILALKALGAQAIVSLSAVGSLREEIQPGDFVVIDQFIDRTTSRPRTFFDEDVVCHVEFADPIDATLHNALTDGCKALGLRHHEAGSYVCIEGPQFSTRAESHLFRSWGASVVGMTNLPEARLAREAELPYATVALATDYDCWKEHEASVSVKSVLEILKQNAENAQRLLQTISQTLPDRADFEGKYSIRHSILSDLSKLGQASRTRLAPLIEKYC
ncbi:MAG: S-methyl-5'-thioadenosine phosphorylase [Myxococcales bacterium]|nr:MAG: S-methyl-5'-thioadenosine phosphorylase [Myxococcales bacterium]